MAKDGLFIQGDKALIRKLERLKGAVRRRIVIGAVSKALTPAVKAARRAAPVKTGLLKASIGKKTKRYRRSGTVVGLVGARIGFDEVVDGKKVDPANYGKVVEFHTRFLRTAWRAQRNRVLSILSRDIARRVNAVARRGR